MRKMIWKLCLFIGILASVNITAYAETSHGKSDWSVVFTKDKKMEANFKTSDLDEVIYGLQPGDNVIITLKLKNENTSATDWYMTNEVLSSLEDSQSSASGGAYTYELTYVNHKGETSTLYSSENVGGEKSSAAGEGLHEVTDNMDEFSIWTDLLLVRTDRLV